MAYMTISQTIAKLEELKQQHGDLPVAKYYDSGTVEIYSVEIDEGVNIKLGVSTPFPQVTIC